MGRQATRTSKPLGHFTGSVFCFPMFFFRSRDASQVCGSLDLRRCQSRGQVQARVTGWGSCWGKSVPLSFLPSTFRVAGPERRTWRHQGCKYTFSPPQLTHLLSEMYPSNQQSVALSHTDRRTQRTSWPPGKKGKDPLTPFFPYCNGAIVVSGLMASHRAPPHLQGPAGEQGPRGDRGDKGEKVSSRPQ